MPGIGFRIPQVEISRPAYQRRLIAAGLLSTRDTVAGVANLTNDGYEVADNIRDVLIRIVESHWPTDVVEHPAAYRDSVVADFAKRLSPNYASFRVGDGWHLCSDLNLAHIEWLRGHPEVGSGPQAVLSGSGLYRPVAKSKALVRDEFIFPFYAVHVAAPDHQVKDTWSALHSVVRTFASAAGIPLLLVNRRAPSHYAEACTAALLPAPDGTLQPWMLGYRLSECFSRILGRPGFSVYEIGISGRMLAFLSVLQQSPATVLGSAVCSHQFSIPPRAHAAIDQAESAPPLLDEFRVARWNTGRCPSSLPLVALDAQIGASRMLFDGYTAHLPVHLATCNDAHELLREADHRARHTGELALSKFLAEYLSRSPAAQCDDLVIDCADERWIGRRL